MRARARARRAGIHADQSVSRATQAWRQWRQYVPAGAFVEREPHVSVAIVKLQRKIASVPFTCGKLGVFFAKVAQTITLVLYRGLYRFACDVQAGRKIAQGRAQFAQVPAYASGLFPILAPLTTGASRGLICPLILGVYLGESVRAHGNVAKVAAVQFFAATFDPFPFAHINQSAVTIGASVPDSRICPRVTIATR